MSAIILDGKILHYEVLGRGKPIIFLHGWIGSWRYWIPAMQAASTSYRAYALDLWGFGESAKASEFYTLEQQTELIDRFMKAMGIGKVALVGHGLGSVVALLYASKNAYVVDRVMMIGLPINQHDLSEQFGSTHPIDMASRVLEDTPGNSAARSEAVKTDQFAIRTSLEDLKSIDLMRISHRLTTASLLVHGLRDPVIHPPDLSANGTLPNMIHHIVFGESGHFPMLDQPNKFRRLMTDFLDLSSGESPQRLQLKDEWKRRVR